MQHLSLSLPHTHFTAAVGFKIEDLKVNDGIMRGKQKRRRENHGVGPLSALQIKFPRDYNVGDGRDETGEKMMTVTSGKTVKIRCTPHLEAESRSITC